jgi:hypothetical protein
MIEIYLSKNKMHLKLIALSVLDIIETTACELLLYID